MVDRRHALIILACKMDWQAASAQFGPLYIRARGHHIYLPRSTLCDWKLATAELLQVLMPPLKAHLLNAPRVHADDTTMPLRVPGSPTTRTARLRDHLDAGQCYKNGLWVDYLPAVLFEFAQSRQGLHPLGFLKD